MMTVSGVNTFSAAGMTFCEIPEGDVMIDDKELDGKWVGAGGIEAVMVEKTFSLGPQSHHVRQFALAQKPAHNFEMDSYAERMGDLTHGHVARRKSDGRPFVVERTRADGSGSQPGTIASDRAFTQSIPKLVRLVPDPNRYVTRLGERAACFIGPHLPATLVTGCEALGWANFLARESGRDVMLPTSVQWQYAAQGGQGGPEPIAIIHNHDGGKREGTEPLNREGWQGLLNLFGLLDMMGNVWEPTVAEKMSSPGVPFSLRWFGGLGCRSIELDMLIAMNDYYSGTADLYDGVRVAIALSRD